MVIAAFILALVWGGIWALCLQSRPGFFLAARFTWLTVVIGVGGDLLIGLLIVPIEIWIQFAALVALSSVGIIARSLNNEHHDQRMLHTMLHGDKDTPAQ